MALVRRERPEWPEMFRRWFDMDRWIDPSWDAGWLGVEEFRDGDEIVVRAELPGIDPDKDVELSVSDGTLHLRAHKEERAEHKDKDSYRSEFRYGSFARNIVLPPGADESAVKASYRDGVLEVRVPAGKEEKPEIKRIPIDRG